MDLLTVTKKEFVAQIKGSQEDLEMQGLDDVYVEAMTGGFYLIDDIRKNYKPKKQEDLEFVLMAVFEALDSEAYTSAMTSAEDLHGFSD